MIQGIVFVSSILYSIPILQASTLHNFVPIGLFGEKFTSYDEVNIDGSHSIAAMLLAVNDVNNKTDGIFDNVLPFTGLKFALRGTRSNFLLASLHSQEFNFNVFNGSGVIGVIGSGYDSSSKAAGMTFANTLFKINMIDYYANDSALSHAQNFPYFSRVVPSRGYGGRAIADFISLYFGWHTVNLISTLDTYGTDASSQFTTAAYDLGIDIENKLSFWPGTNSFETLLSDLSRHGVLKVFVLIMSSADAGAFMEAGYNAGLFKVGTQIIGTQFLVMPAVWQAMSPNAPVDKIMKGVIAITPQLVNKTESRYKSFVHRFMSQTDTKKTSSNGSVLMCSDRKDDDGGTFLFIANKTTPLGPNTCAGIEYSKLSSDDLHDMVPYAYDAVIAMAHALHHVLYTQGNASNFTGDDIRDAIIHHVDFDGVTGRIKFSPGVGGNEGYGAGDRETGLTYRAMIFHAAYDYAGVLHFPQSIRTIGHLHHKTSDHGSSVFTPCDSRYESDCVVPTFNTVDGDVLDANPDVLEVEIEWWFRRLFRVGGSLGLVTVAFYLFIIRLYADTRLIKTSQPEIKLAVLFGGAMASLLILLHSFDLSDEICMSTMWLGHLAFAFTFIALLVKTWRISKIVNSGFSRVKVTVRQMLILLLVCLLFFCLILVVDTVVGRPHRGYEETFDGHKLIRLIKCSNDTPNVTRALFVIEACVICYGAWLCRSAKNAPSSVNDTSNIVMALYLILFVCAVTFPIVFLSIDPTPQNLTVTMCVGFFVGIIGVINIVFARKALLAVEGADVSDDMEIIRSQEFKRNSLLPSGRLLVTNLIRKVSSQILRQPSSVSLSVRKPAPMVGKEKRTAPMAPGRFDLAVGSPTIHGSMEPCNSECTSSQKERDRSDIQFASQPKRGEIHVSKPRLTKLEDVSCKELEDDYDSADATL